MFPGDPWEDLEDDYSGCTWTSSVFEFPTWTGSLEKTLSENFKDVLCVPKPLTPQKLVTSNTAKVDFVDTCYIWMVDRLIRKNYALSG